MNELQLNKPPEYIRHEVEAVNRAKDEAAYTVINLGKRLCELKAACRHGEFVALAEGCCGLGKRQCQNLTRIYQEFGEKRTAVRFSANTLLELTRAPEPEAALSEAVARKEAGEDITAKQAKEIARLHKDLEQAKQQAEQAKPSLATLIPELTKLHKSGSLPEATALEFSKLDPDIQRYAVLPKFEQVNRQQSEITRPH